MSNSPSISVPSVYREQDMTEKTKNETLVILDFSEGDQSSEVPGEWRGFSDRVMGGVSDAEFDADFIDDVVCFRLRGHVTRDNGGGFVQMARELGINESGFDASAFKGL